MEISYFCQHQDAGKSDEKQGLLSEGPYFPTFDPEIWKLRWLHLLALETC